MASQQHGQTSHILGGAAVVLRLCAGTVGPASAQSGVRVLTRDKRNPNDQILRCGSDPGTIYRPVPAAEDGLPASVQLDSGALLIEFRSKQRREFQILTPQAIASVRSTKWAMRRRWRPASRSACGAGVRLP
jgi:hypothetical protein